MSTKSTQRFVFIIASLLFSYVFTNRHPMFVNCLVGQVPSIITLLAIGFLQTPSSLADQASSASRQLVHRYTSMLIGVVILAHHAVESKLQVVNTRNFKDTSYFESPVSLRGENIFIALRKPAVHTNVTWRFSNDWQIQLEKCDGPQTAKIEIADSCKWKFDWDDTKKFTLSVNDNENIWKFPENDTRRIQKLRIRIGKDDQRMYICTVPDKGECTLNDMIDLSKSVPLKPPDFCMLDTDSFSVNVTLKDPECRIDVTIMNALLLYDFYEPTAAPMTTQNVTNATSRHHNNMTRSSTSPDEPPKPFPTWAIIVAGVGGPLVLIAIVGLIGLLVFCCVCRRRQRAQFDDNADINGQVAQTEGLIEWEDIMAHAAYKPKIGHQPDEKDWPFRKGDEIDLTTITECDYSPETYKMLTFREDVKGSEDYGFVEGDFEGKNPAVIYYSKPPDRVKTFLDRMQHLKQVNYTDMLQTNNQRVGGFMLVPELRYYWISPDPQKLSYLIVAYHVESVASARDNAEFHERVGFAFTTFAALLCLHRHGCVHRDVTPASFVVRHRKEGDDQFCYISHLCLSRFLYNIFDKTWMPRRRRVNYFGTHKYASRAAHAMQERSFKDDLESWFFTAVELIWPTTAKEPVMPWHIFNLEIGVTDRAELHAKYKTEKDKFLRNFSKNNLIVTFPAPQFRVFAKEILKMTYETLSSDYGRRFLELLDVMLGQLPTQVDEGNQKEFLAYMQNLKASGSRTAARNKLFD